MKSSVWMIQEIFKMLNQYAEDIPTLPVNQCYSHLIQFLRECYAVPQECQVAKKGRQAFGTHMEKPKTFFANPAASSSALYAKELNPWSSGISENTHSSHVGKSENQTPVQDQRCQSLQPEIQSSPVREILQRILEQTNNDCRSHIFISTILHSSNIRLLEDKIQDWGMYLFTISYGSYVVDQRSGAGWFSGWSKNLRAL